LPSFETSVASLIASGPILQVFVGPSREIIAALGASAVSAAIQVSALIDTGAQSTVINSAVAQQLNLRAVGSTAIHTATTTKPVRCREVHVNIYLWHEFTIENLIAIEAPMSGHPFQCVIGRDILSRGTLVYAGRENRFTLTF